MSALKPARLWLTNRSLNKAQAIISDADQSIVASSVSFWEMAIKASIGRLTLPSNLLETLRQENIEILPMSAEEGLAVADLPPLHSDPFDRLLVIQAKRHGMVLITRDAKVMEYPVVTIKA